MLSIPFWIYNKTKKLNIFQRVIYVFDELKILNWTQIVGLLNILILDICGLDSDLGLNLSPSKRICYVPPRDQISRRVNGLAMYSDFSAQDKIIMTRTHVRYTKWLILTHIRQIKQVQHFVLKYNTINIVFFLANCDSYSWKNECNYIRQKVTFLVFYREHNYIFHIQRYAG